VHAAATYATDQRMAQERQRDQQMRFQQDLMSREAQFKQAHPTGTYRDDMSMDEYKAWRKRTSTLPAWKER
jgi:hypothetical protein